MTTRRFWMSSDAMTIEVTVVDGVITETPPIARRFLGQQFFRLRRWMMNQGNYTEKVLERVQS